MAKKKKHSDTWAWIVYFVAFFCSVAFIIGYILGKNITPKGQFNLSDTETVITSED